MASQPGSSSSATSTIEIKSFVWCVYAYKDIWELREGEVLLLKHEPDNVQDKLAFAMMRSRVVAWHVPKMLAPVLSHLLERRCNKGIVLITGKGMNRGGDHGLEAP